MQLLTTNSEKFSLNFKHHPDAASFKNALELPCSICALAWGAEIFPHPLHFSKDRIATGTWGRLMGNSSSNSPITIRITFYEGLFDSESRPLVFTAWNGTSFG